MSSAFTDEQREKIRNDLLLAGTQLAETVGFKKMTIASVAKKAGVATGTFYNFFDSKESFACAVLQYNDTVQMELIADILSSDKKIPAREFFKVYRECFRPENIFLLRLSLDDWIWMRTHISDCSLFDMQTSMDRFSVLISKVEGLKKDINPGVVVNFIKTVFTIYQNREYYIEDSIATNVDLIFDALYRYVAEE